jgi:hypothetical protein
VAGAVVREGDVLAVDGDRGIVSLEVPPVATAGADERLQRLRGWRAG